MAASNYVAISTTLTGTTLRSRSQALLQLIEQKGATAQQTT